jgi:hypothetical protein
MELLGRYLVQGVAVALVALVALVAMICGMTGAFELFERNRDGSRRAAALKLGAAFLLASVWFAGMMWAQATKEQAANGAKPDSAEVVK